MSITAVYAGSFDPLTLGHIDVINRARSLVSRLIVAVGVNSAKQPLFDQAERIDIIRHSVVGIGVEPFQGLLADFCKQHGAHVIVRGLRAVTDYEQELVIANVNHKLTGIDTMFLMARPDHSFISSSVVKDLVRHSQLEDLEQNLAPYVNTVVLERLQARYQR